MGMFFINYLNICFLGLIKYKIWNCINLPFVMCFLPFRSLQFKNLWSYKISSLCKAGWNFFLAFYYTHGWWWWNIFFLFLDSWKSTVVHTCNLKFTLLIFKIHVDFLSTILTWTPGTEHRAFDPSNNYSIWADKCWFVEDNSICNISECGKRFSMFLQPKKNLIKRMLCIA